MEKETFEALRLIINTIGLIELPLAEATAEDVHMYGELATIDALPDAWLKVYDWVEANYKMSGN
jgi:hypothetical protein